MTPLRTLLIVLLFPAALASAASPAATAPQDVILKDVDEQPLPAGIVGVVVAPDDKVWCENNLGDRTVKPATLKAEIQRQWTKDFPRLTGARPVLFETGKRIWFAQTDGTFLLGYDGKEFLEHTLPKGARLTGSAKEASGDYTRISNCQVDTRVFFSTTRGVTSFDGAAWTDRDFLRAREKTYVFGMRPLADGKTLLVATWTERAESSVWKHANGQWHETRLPARMWGTQPAVTLLPDGTALLSHIDNRPGEEIQRALICPLDAPADAEKWIAQLPSEDFRTRAAAAEKLVAAGPLVAPLLDAAAKTNKDADVATLLAALKAKVTNPPAPSKLGPFAIQSVRWVLPGNDGAVYVVAHGVTEHPREKARGDKTYDQAVLVTTDGQWTLLSADPAVVAAWFPTDPDAARIAPQIAADHVWLPEAGLGARMNRTTGKIERFALPDDVQWIFGQRRDGTLFVGKGNAGPLNNPAVLACRPKKKPTPLPTPGTP